MSQKRRQSADCHQVLDAHDAVVDACEPLKRLRLAEGTPAVATFSPGRYPQKGKPALTPQQPLPTIPERSEHQPRAGGAQIAEVRDVYPDLIELAPSQDLQGAAALSGEELPAAGGVSGDADDEDDLQPAIHRRRQGQTQYRLVLPDRLPVVLPDLVIGQGSAGGMPPLGTHSMPPYHLFALVPYVAPEEALGLGVKGAVRVGEEEVDGMALDAGEAGPVEEDTEDMEE